VVTFILHVLVLDDLAVLSIGEVSGLQALVLLIRCRSPVNSLVLLGVHCSLVVQDLGSGGLLKFGLRVLDQGSGRGADWRCTDGRGLEHTSFYPRVHFELGRASRVHLFHDLGRVVLPPLPRDNTLRLLVRVVP